MGGLSFGNVVSYCMEKSPTKLNGAINESSVWAAIVYGWSMVPVSWKNEHFAKGDQIHGESNVLSRAQR